MKFLKCSSNNPARDGQADGQVDAWNDNTRRRQWLPRVKIESDSIPAAVVTAHLSVFRSLI